MSRTWMVVALALASCATPVERLRSSDAKERRAAARQPSGRPVTAPPPSTPCTADTPVWTYNHQVCCPHVTDVVYPERHQELVQAIRECKEPHLKIVGRLHSSSSVVCSPDREIISTEHLDSLMKVVRLPKKLTGEASEEAVVADPGVTLGQLSRWLYDQGLSIGYTVIGFRDVTVAGAIATAAHGSSLTHDSVVSSRVLGLMVVDGGGHEKTWWRGQTDPDTFRALAGNVGVLGAVSRVWLRVDPRFDLSIKTSFDDDRKLLQGGPRAIVGSCDFGEIAWFPRAHRTMVICGGETTDFPQPGAENVLLSPTASTSAVATFKEVMDDTIDMDAPLCSIEEWRYLQLKSDPPFQRDCCCKRQSTREAIGPGWAMMSSALTQRPDRPEEIDFEVAVPMSRAVETLKFVSDFAGAHHLCLPLVGAFLRFSKRDDSTLIGHSALGDDVMFLELVVYVRDGDPPNPVDPQYYGRYWELARTLLAAPYFGRLHFGKNAPDLFVAERAVDPDYAARLDRFRRIADTLDPRHRWANRFSDAAGLTTPASP